MARPARLAATAATLIGVLLALIGPASAGAAAPSGFYGVNGQAIFLLPPSQWDRQLEAIHDAGLEVVRRDASWNHAEPAAPSPDGVHSYVWTTFDRDVTYLARHNLRWLPVVAYSTEWSGEIAGDYGSPPTRDADYAAYAAALVGRYGPNGDFWRAHPELPRLPVTSYELWNEQNAEHFWHPQAGAPERYADLYMAARAAIRQVDASARVLVGGLALGNAGVADEGDFVRRMYAHRPDLRGNVDGVGFHPYTPDADGALLKVVQFRRTLTGVGAADVPIEITEVGWTTAKTSENERAANLAQLAEALPESGCGVGSLIPHTWVTQERSASNGDDWFGIWNLNGTPKPSGTAYAAAIARVRAGTASTQDPVCGDDAGEPSPVGGVRRFRSSKGPQFRLSVRKASRRGRRVVARLWCPTGCRIKLDAAASGRARGARSTRRTSVRRTLPFSAARRSIRLTAPRGWRSLRVRARAVGGSGGATIRTRTVRIG